MGDELVGNALGGHTMESRRSEVPIEQLLVALKQALGPLCDVFGVPYGQERVAFTSRLVTICIEEFYRRSKP